jgi:hypothetical protein
MADLEAQRDRGDFSRLTKAEAQKRIEEIEKLNLAVVGTRDPVEPPVSGLSVSV